MADEVTPNLVVDPKEQYGMCIEEESVIKGETAQVEVEE